MFHPEQHTHTDTHTRKCDNLWQGEMHLLMVPPGSLVYMTGNCNTAPQCTWQHYKDHSLTRMNILSDLWVPLLHLAWISFCFTFYFCQKDIYCDTMQRGPTLHLCVSCVLVIFPGVNNGVHILFYTRAFLRSPFKITMPLGY